MKAIVVTGAAAGAAGMTLVERPAPSAAINDVIVEVHASGYVPTETAWPSTWTDRGGRDRTPSILGHELAGVVGALGYGTTGVSVGQRVLGLADWHRDGTLAEQVAIEARNLAPLPGDEAVRKPDPGRRNPRKRRRTARGAARRRAGDRLRRRVRSRATG